MGRRLADRARTAAAEWRGGFVRRAYGRRLGSVPPPPEPPRALALSVVSFSGERDLLEQVASIRSLLAHAGAPASWTIVSDGTHAARSRALLEAVHPCVGVVALADAVVAHLCPAVARYARRHPMGKKLALELSLPLDGATLYVDADVLFFPGAARLASLLDGGDDRAPRYLLDCGAYLDRRLLRHRGEAVGPVNGGVFLLRRPLDWRAALGRLDRLDGVPDFFTEQTLLHLAMHGSAARPLDPVRYVVSLQDERAFGDAFAGPGIVLRHYTTPVRHKLWCAAARWGA